MKPAKVVSLAYTPGLFLWAQPSPKLTTPACTQVPFTIWHTRGPPESPWKQHTKVRRAVQISAVGRFQSAQHQVPQTTRATFCVGSSVRLCNCAFVTVHKQLIQQHLAGVFAALLVSCADHVIQDVRLIVRVQRVHLLTWSLRHDWHHHFLQRSHSLQRHCTWHHRDAEMLVVRWILEASTFHSFFCTLSFYIILSFKSSIAFSAYLCKMLEQN